jgi:hypothetical protein
MAPQWFESSLQRAWTPRVPYNHIMATNLGLTPPVFCQLQRRQTRNSLDLGNLAARAMILDLVLWADVVTESF